MKIKLLGEVATFETHIDQPTVEKLLGNLKRYIEWHHFPKKKTEDLRKIVKYLENRKKMINDKLQSNKCYEITIACYEKRKTE